MVLRSIGSNYFFFMVSTFSNLPKITWFTFNRHIDLACNHNLPDDWSTLTTSCQWYIYWHLVLLTRSDILYCWPVLTSCIVDPFWHLVLLTCSDILYCWPILTSCIADPFWHLVLRIRSDILYRQILTSLVFRERLYFELLTTLQKNIVTIIMYFIFIKNLH